MSWTAVQFDQNKIEVAENAGIVVVSISRYGNLHQVNDKYKWTDRKTVQTRIYRNVTVIHNNGYIERL